LTEAQTRREAEAKATAEAMIKAEREAALAAGGIVFVTEPMGANVRLGQQSKISPANFTGVKPGKYPYQIELMNYEIEQGEAEIVGGVDRRMPVFTLIQSKGELALEVDPSEAEFEVRDAVGKLIQTGTKNWVFTALAAGQYQVKASHSALGEVTQTVDVKGKTRAVAKLALPYGTVKVASEPTGAKISQAGGDLGTTPRTFSLVRPGSVTLQLDLGGYKPETVSGIVSNGQTLELAGKLERALVVPEVGRPFENSLGMKFVPVPGTQVLFSIWETRVKDFAAFVRDSANNRGWDYRSGSQTYVLKSGEGEQFGWDYGWDKPGFEQTPEHPVTCVSWDDAVAFCRWLSETERQAGRLRAGQEYRLPTDSEWNAAVGSTRYPWGNNWPPQRGNGNYAGAEVKDPDWPPDKEIINGYRDAYARTSPVGSFDKNGYGLFDLGGNVWEWCVDWYRWSMNTAETRRASPTLGDDDSAPKYRVIRGGSWSTGVTLRLASDNRDSGSPRHRASNCGFRCVLALPRPARSAPSAR
jgi:formylglycine-generating enzyme required for sulfatase activity